MEELKKGYKKTKIGVIPEDWEVKRLEDIAKFYKGKRISKSDISNNGEIECIRYGELYTYYQEVINDVISKTNLKADELVLSRNNDILIPSSGETAIDLATASCILKDNVAIGSDINIIRTNQNGIFLSYYLNNVAKNQIARLAQGISVIHLYSIHLKSIMIALPPLKEQEKIAKILSTWDKAIELQKELIKEKEKLKTALMQKLLSGKVRFKEFSEKWEEVRLRNIAKRITRKNTVGNENVLTISAQYGLVNQENFFNKSVASKDLSNYILLKKGEFAYNKSYSNGYPMGAFKRLNLYKEGVLSNLYIYFKIENNDLDFYEQYFEAGLMNKEIYKIAQEGARNHGLLNMNIKEFFNMKIMKPPLAEQQKIAKVLSTADKEIELLKDKLKELKKQKKALMQKLLTGKVRVKV